MPETHEEEFVICCTRVRWSNPKTRRKSPSTKKPGLAQKRPDWHRNTRTCVEKSQKCIFFLDWRRNFYALGGAGIYIYIITIYNIYLVHMYIYHSSSSLQNRIIHQSSNAQLALIALKKDGAPRRCSRRASNSARGVVKSGYDLKVR